MTKGKTHLQMFKELKDRYTSLDNEVLNFVGVFDSEENANKFEELIHQQVDARCEIIAFLTHSDKNELIDLILDSIGIKAPEYVNINLEVSYEK